MPLSIDRLPQNELQKAVYKLRKKHEFEKVVQMNLRETDEEAFVATLHGIDPEKMDKLVKEESKTKQSSTDKDKSTSVGDADAEKELKEKSSESPELSSSMVLSE